MTKLMSGKLAAAPSMSHGYVRLVVVPRAHLYARQSDLFPIPEPFQRQGKLPADHPSARELNQSHYLSFYKTSFPVSHRWRCENRCFGWHKRLAAGTTGSSHAPNRYHTRSRHATRAMPHDRSGFPDHQRPSRDSRQRWCCTIPTHCQPCPARRKCWLPAAKHLRVEYTRPRLPRCCN